MTRLLSRMVWDARLQARNGFYYAAAFVVGLLVIMLSWLPEQIMAWVLPLVLFGNLVTNGFYFVGGLVLLEKAEGSLEAQSVTPLRESEYLLAKIVTLCGLSLVESTLIVAYAYGGDTHWLPMLAGVVLMTASLACFGFLTVARYDSINAYLFPSFLVTTVLALPLLDLLGIWSSAPWYLHPIHASLVLLRAGFEPVAATTMSIALIVASLWLAVAFTLCVQGFSRFVVAREGAS